MIDLTRTSDPHLPLNADLRHLRTALEAIDLPALGEAERIELERWMTAARVEARANATKWRRVSERPCLKALAGVPCSSPDACLCDRYRVIIDHWAVWEGDGITRITLEPYEVGGMLLADFLHAMDGLGFTSFVGGCSEYAPECFLIDLRRGPDGVDL